MCLTWHIGNRKQKINCINGSTVVYQQRLFYLFCCQHFSVFSIRYFRYSFCWVCVRIMHWTKTIYCFLVHLLESFCHFVIMSHSEKHIQVNLNGMCHIHTNRIQRQKEKEKKRNRYLIYIRKRLVSSSIFAFVVALCDSTSERCRHKENIIIYHIMENLRA